MELEAFELVLLRRPQHARQYDDAAIARIQREHLAHHAGLRNSGEIVTNGPVVDQGDEALRGLTVYRVGSLEVELMRWLCPLHTMRLSGHTVTVDDD
jgi:hypothetical protein